MSVGVQVGAIVPWNYPFHNVFNPLVAAGVCVVCVCRVSVRVSQRVQPLAAAVASICTFVLVKEVN